MRTHNHALQKRMIRWVSPIACENNIGSSMKIQIIIHLNRHVSLHEDKSFRAMRYKWRSTEILMSFWWRARSLSPFYLGSIFEKWSKKQDQTASCCFLCTLTACFLCMCTLYHIVSHYWKKCFPFFLLSLGTSFSDRTRAR